MTTAIILAAGSGKRMNSNTSKQYMNIEGYPVLYYTLKAFEKSEVENIVVVCGKDDVEYVRKEIIDKYKINKIKNVVSGGKERYESSYNGIVAAGDSDYVMIHDAARPCVSVSVINELIRETKDNNACIVGVPVKDTIKRVSDKVIVESLNREELYQIQTPQCFRKDLLIDAYKKMIDNNDYSMTDDSMVIEKYTNCKVRIIMGEYTNIKLTTPEDMLIIKEFIKK